MGFGINMLFLAVVLALSGCDPVVAVPETEEVSLKDLQRFIGEVKKNMVFVEGGDFLMGDYGVQHGPERLPYDMDKDSKPLHRVELSSYFIEKFKITNQAYHFYLSSNGLQLREIGGAGQKKWMDINSLPNMPAHLDWFEAEQYCSWLARISGLPFALPTEAQWEYAARSRGEFLMVATDDGTYKTTNDSVTKGWGSGPKGINISSSWDREAFAKQMGWRTGTLTPLPVDKFPPNPLGLYAMSDNGFEWVKDWYDPDYYQYSPVKDPQGPDRPVFKDLSSNNKYAKVLRGVNYANPKWGGGVNVQRNYKNPDGYFKSLVVEGDLLNIFDKTARCVINSSTPIK